MSGEIKQLVLPGVAQPGQSARFGAARPQVQLLPPGPDSPPISAELLARFWVKVQKAGPDECWPWIGAKFKGGYGSFSVGRPRLVTATRYVYFLSTGHWPGHYKVLHSCDNPPCCNPAHLWLGFQSDNAKDMVAKGRHARAAPKGSQSSHAKLTEADIPEIRRASAWGETDTSIAARYGVHSSSIRKIRLGQSWKHVA